MQHIMMPQFLFWRAHEMPSELGQLLDNNNDEQEVYQSQMQLVKGLAELKCNDELFLSIIKDIQAQFCEHQSCVHVSATVEQSNSFVRPAITFMIATDKNRKVTTTHDIFLSAQKIDDSFRQTAEEIQDAMLLKNNDGSRYWYRLDVFQNLLRNGEIRLDGRSAGAAIGWLIFSIEEELERKLPLVEEGGYIPSIDEEVPLDVPFESFAYYNRLLKAGLGLLG